MPASKPKVKIVCQRCGKSFFVQPYDSTRKFCSHPCAMLARIGVPNSKLAKTKIIKQCLKCGTSFEIHPYRKDSAGFCSVSCATSYRTGEQSAHWKGGDVERKCQNCGKSFLVPRSRDDALYCSKSCHSSFKIRGEKCNFWQGGITAKGYPHTFNDQFKKMVREHDNYTCALCGEFGNHVHHINYIKDDVTLENCITLCHSCHTKTNFNREYWTKFFQSRPR